MKNNMKVRKYAIDKAADIIDEIIDAIGYLQERQNELFNRKDELPAWELTELDNIVYQIEGYEKVIAALEKI